VGNSLAPVVMAVERHTRRRLLARATLHRFPPVERGPAGSRVAPAGLLARTPRSECSHTLRVLSYNSNRSARPHSTGASRSHRLGARHRHADRLLGTPPLQRGAAPCSPRQRRGGGK
jgi:hypothetical protein